MALCLGLSRWAGARGNIHPTILYQLPLSAAIHSILPIQFTCLTVFMPLSKSTLVYLLVSNPPFHTPYISSPNHCLLFATHAHTIAACFAIVLRLCHVFLALCQLITWNSIFHLDIKEVIATHTHTQPFYGSMDFSGTTHVSQKNHSPSHTCRHHQ